MPEDRPATLRTLQVVGDDPETLVMTPERTEVEVARLQLQVKALEDRVERIDRYGTMEVHEVDGKIQVLNHEVKAIAQTQVEMRLDLKSLLHFQSLVVGAAAVVSLVISVVSQFIGRWITSHTP